MATTSLRSAVGASGIVKDRSGKGDPKKDTVDAKLAEGEAVLPAETVDALGGAKAVSDLIEETTGKAPAPKLEDGKLHAVTGATGDQIKPSELRPEFRSQAQTPVIEPAANPGLEAARDARARLSTASLPNTPPVAAASYTPTQPVAPAAETGPSLFQRARAGFNGMTGSPNVGDAAKGAGEAILSGAKTVANNPVVGAASKVIGGVAKSVPYVAAATDGARIADVATDPNKTGADTAAQVARTGGNWASAYVGAKTGAGLANMIPIPHPGVKAATVGVGGLVGGTLGYLGADSLMNQLAGKAPSATSNGVLTKAFAPSTTTAQPTATQAPAATAPTKPTVDDVNAATIAQAKQVAANTAAQPGQPSLRDVANQFITTGRFQQSAGEPTSSASKIQIDPNKLLSQLQAQAERKWQGKISTGPYSGGGVGMNNLELVGARHDVEAYGKVLGLLQGNQISAAKGDDDFRGNNSRDRAHLLASALGSENAAEERRLTREMTAAQHADQNMRELVNDTEKRRLNRAKDAKGNVDPERLKWLDTAAGSIQPNPNATPDQLLAQQDIGARAYSNIHSQGFTARHDTPATDFQPSEAGLMDLLRAGAFPTERVYRSGKTGEVVRLRGLQPDEKDYFLKNHVAR